MKFRGSRPGRRKSGEPLSGPYGAKIYTDREMEFMNAVEDFKRINKRPFPYTTDYLWIMKKLGYRKISRRLKV